VIFNGFGKIVQGVLERRYSVPVFLISLGILSLGVAILVGHAEQFGTIFLTRILSLVLILCGMQMVFFGIMGEVSIAKNFEKIVAASEIIPMSTILLKLSPSCCLRSPPPLIASPNSKPIKSSLGIAS
jgi:hypothetical protein